jgi:hypothetical protein
MTGLLAEAVRGVADPIASIRETSWILVSTQSRDVGDERGLRAWGALLVLWMPAAIVRPIYLIVGRD